VLADVFGVLATGLVLAAILELVLPQVLGPIRLSLALDVGIAMVAAGGLALAVWALDRLPLGHGAFVAVGAYTAAAVGYYGHILGFGTIQHQGGFLGPSAGLYVGALAAGAVAAALAGAVVAAPTVRAHPVVLPVVTLLLAEGVRRWLVGTSDVLADPTTIRTAPYKMLATSLGGEVGFTSAPFLTSPFWVGVALAALWATALVVKHRPPPATLGSRIGVFAVAAGFAGLAGGLLAHSVGAVQRPGEFGVGPSLELLAIALIGGWGSVSGASVAAIAVVLLRELPAVAEHRMAIYGVVVVALVGLRARGWLPTWEVWELRARLPRRGGR
jgi:branched-chain amino acid transport system permease protein